MIEAYELSSDSVAAPVSLLTGDDTYWIEHSLGALTSDIPVAEREYRIRVFDPCDNISELISYLNCYSFTGDGNVAIVRGRKAKITAADAKLLTSYCAAPAEGNRLIICDTAGVFGCVTEYAVTISCAAVSEARVMQITKDAFNAAGLTADNTAATLLVNYCSSDLGRICREIDKLSAYSPENNIVDSKLIAAMVAPDAHAKAYELTDALSSGKRDAAADILAQLTASGSAPAYLLRVLSGAYRNLLHVRISSLDDAALASALGIGAYAVRRLKRVASGYSATRLKSLSDMLNDLEFHFKSGKLSAESALDLAIGRLMEATA
ncbi:MAG: DNA polymerase III subunit delta [Clostridia bacterium]|nr:DNA polymerase III subunit delta [Clostridia bacterium]